MYLEPYHLQCKCVWDSLWSFAIRSNRLATLFSETILPNNAILPSHMQDLLIRGFLCNRMESKVVYCCSETFYSQSSLAHCWKPTTNPAFQLQSFHLRSRPSCYYTKYQTQQTLNSGSNSDSWLLVSFYLERSEQLTALGFGGFCALQKAVYGPDLA